MKGEDDDNSNPFGNLDEFQEKMEKMLKDSLPAFLSGVLSGASKLFKTAKEYEQFAKRFSEFTRKCIEADKRETAEKYAGEFTNWLINSFFGERDKYSLTADDLQIISRIFVEEIDVVSGSVHNVVGRSIKALILNSKKGSSSVNKSQAKTTPENFRKSIPVFKKIVDKSELPIEFVFKNKDGEIVTSSSDDLYEFEIFRTKPASS